VVLCLAMHPNRVRQDDEIFGCIQRLAGAEEFGAKGRVEHAHTCTCGAMKNDHGLTSRVAQCGVTDVHGWHDLPRMKAEVFGCLNFSRLIRESLGDSGGAL
jgi:hypothetical protein